MLDSLRRGATGWVAKIFLGLLILSFAVWGVADVFTGYNEGALARVGKREISTAEFQRALQTELEILARQIGRRPTLEQARAWGLDSRVLARLIGSAAIEAHAEDMRLGISDEAIADSIRKDPAFQNPDGTFNRIALESVARELGVNEHGLIALRRKEEVRGQLTDALTSGAFVPSTLLDALHAYRNETRAVEHFTIDPAVAVTLQDPDPAKLEETYEANKQRFMTPEYRKLAVVGLTIEEVKKRVPVSDEEIAAAYEHDKARYELPERRRVLQLAFRDRAEAEKAAAGIAAGRSFEEIAKEAGIGESDYTLGLLSRSELIDPTVAEAAFGLGSGAVSGVVEGRFAPVLVKVTEIQPGKQRTLDEVRGQVRDRLAQENAGPELQRLHDEVDDGRAAGKPLKEIAAELKLPFAEIAATDRTGKAPDGTPAIEGPDLQRILNAAFQGRVDTESDSIELADGGYGWVDVIAVTEARQRTFEEARTDVARLWREQETRQVLSDLGAKLAERASQGESMEALAKETGGKVETARDIKRIGGSPGLPDSAVGQAFITPQGGAASAETRDGASRIVFKVTEATPAPAPTAAERERLRTDVGRQIESDVVAGYLAALQERIGVSINEAAYRRAVGADQQQQQ
ncbi:MAG: SurA N-terminal domain-containing protein [Hyphomicrobiaceae bacterium]|nr:SurA N-terminal domain-containing protein [Hyphomicrobiaceae bacterium]